jgi:HAD superfamily hydrolase (TIGR01509 family)
VRVDPAAVEAAEPDLRRELALYSWASTPDQGRSQPQAGGPAFFRRLLELAAASGEPAELETAARAIWESHLRRNVWSRVGPGVDSALGRLRAAGVKLAVVSNSEGTVGALLAEVGLARHLDTVVDSWVVGVAKPDPRIFRIALERLAVSATDAVMVGDSLAADVAGAQAAGMDAVLLDPLDVHPASDVLRFADVPAVVDALLGRAEEVGS